MTTNANNNSLEMMFATIVSHAHPEQSTEIRKLLILFVLRIWCACVRVCNCQRRGSGGTPWLLGKQPIQEVQRLGIGTALIFVVAPIRRGIPPWRHDGSRVHNRQTVSVAHGVCRMVLYRSMTLGFRQSSPVGVHCMRSPIGDCSASGARPRPLSNHSSC